MRSTICFLVFLLTSLIFSCKEHSPVEPKPDFTDAIQLNTGNYWVYRSAEVLLQSGTSTTEPDDSIYIRKDTLVNGARFYVLENLFGLNQIIGKQSGTLVDPMGNINFSGTNFTDTLYEDADRTQFGMMKTEDNEITVPAGTFKTVLWVVFVRNVAGNNPSTDPTNPSVYNRAFSYASKTWYAEKIGMIKRAVYYGNSNSSEISLMRYKVN